MNGLTAWMERHILPVAAKIGAQKHLVALRDAFIGTLPATMAGSIAVMINAIIRDLPPAFIDGYDGNTISSHPRNHHGQRLCMERNIGHCRSNFRVFMGL